MSILSGVDDIQVGLELLPPHLSVHELPGDVGRPHPEGADHAQLGVHQALRGGDERVGRQTDLNAGISHSITLHFLLSSQLTKMVSSGHIGCLAAMSRVVALSRAHLQQRGHHEADACGREEVQQGE